MIVVHNPVSDKYLESLPPTPPPGSSGRYWKYVPHGDIARLLYHALAERGWRPRQQVAALSARNKDMVLAAELPAPGALLPAGSAAYLAMVHSNGGHRRPTAYLGVGEPGGAGVPLLRHHMSKKYSTTFDTHDACEEVAQWAGEGMRVVPWQTQELQAARIDEVAATDLLMEAGRRKILPWSRIGRADRTFRESRETDGDSAWALLRAFARMSALSAPIKQLQQTYEFRVLVGSVIG